MEQQISFCRTSDGTRIAYMTIGEGPPIVFPAWWYSHLEVLWDYPPARTFFEGLAEHFTVVYYDKPGCGLSDREEPDLTLDDQVRTLATVVNHLALPRFALYGFSQGGPAAITYTVRYSERVAHLTLFSTGARTPPPDDPQAAAVWEATKALIKAHWGLGSSVLAQIPGADPLTRDWIAKHMQVSVDPDTAIAMLELFWTFDVMDLLPQVQAPSLVLHRRDDAVFPFERGREMAASIPNARFQVLDGFQHALYQGKDQDVLRITTQYLDDPAIAGRFNGIRERAHPDHLSEREVQVLQLVAAGRSNREIADWLVISPNTVIRHVSNIFDKTGVANRAEAATYANRHGLVE